MAKLPFFPADGLYLKDDFYGETAATTGLIGELQWDIVAITGAGTPAYVAAEADGSFGVLRIISDATANHGEVLTLFPDGLHLEGQGGFLRGKFRIHDVLAGNQFRFGLQNSVTATDSTVGIWVDMLAGVVSVQADSSHGDNTLTVTGIPTLTGGTTMVLDTWHIFEVRWSGENAQGGPAIVDAWVDGYYAGQIACAIDDDETMEFSMTHWDTSAGATLEVDVDYVELFIAR
jgi:hypothetical protein